uniref:Uncharacterized protein n=1 Tax=Bracon brevicornis TaxID=1563983 RepID=A0A6V7K3K9_9HYME
MIQAKHAIARLTEQIGMHKLGSIPVGGTYRSERKDSISSDPDTDEEEHEVHDEEDHDRAGTVVFPVDSIHE